MTAPADVTALFLAHSRRQLRTELWPRLRQCVESLTPDQLWWRPNEQSNSAGNLLLHLEGNVRQWLITGLGGGHDERNRPAEFAERGPMPAADLLARLDQTLQETDALLARLTAADLTRTWRIQGYDVTGLDAIYHVVEHFGMHCGQVYLLTKMLTGDDLGFYRELDRTGRRP